MTSLAGRIISSDSRADSHTASATPVAHRERVVALPIVIVTALVVIASCGLRWELARDTLWQCDEIPLLVRFTGLCGLATNEAEAAAFEPTRWSLYNGALRSVHVPKYPSALHTTTGFWTFSRMSVGSFPETLADPELVAHGEHIAHHPIQHETGGELIKNKGHHQRHHCDHHLLLRRIHLLHRCDFLL